MADSHSFLLVHGAWHGPWCWKRVEAQLRERGHDVHTVNLPSSGPDPSSLTDMYEDAATVRGALDEIEGSAVVVAHSYGGMAVTEGAAGAGNVAHIVYLTAFMLDEGESLFGAVGSVEPDWWNVSEDGRTVIPERPGHVFYNDCTSADAGEAASRLQPQLVDSFKQPIRSVAWREAPSTYVTCTLDNAIPLFAQEQMAQRAGRVHSLETSHSPFLAQPEAVVTLLSEVV